MPGFVARRLVGLIVTLFLVVSAGFIVLRVAPGGPFSVEPTASPAVLRGLAQTYRSTDALIKQYGDYLLRALRFELGPSYVHADSDVSDHIALALPRSISLGSLAIAVAVVFGVSAGIGSALKRRSVCGRVVTSLMIIGLFVPLFVIGPALVFIFGLKLNWLPVAGWLGRSGPAALVLPVVTLASPAFALITRYARRRAQESLDSDLVRAAQAEGLNTTAIAFRYLLKATLVAIVGRLGPVLSVTIVGSVVVEYVFQIPGLGRRFVISSLSRDYTMIVGIVIVYSTVFLVLRCVVGILRGFLGLRGSNSLRDATRHNHERRIGDRSSDTVQLSPWDRFRKNRAAVISLVVAALLAAVTLIGPILLPQLHGNEIAEHRYLPPSFRTAADLLIEREESRIEMANHSGGATELTTEQRVDLDVFRERMATETTEVDGKSVLVHQRRYLLGTDALGRDMLTRVMHGGQISILIALFCTVVSVLLGAVVGGAAACSARRLERRVTGGVGYAAELPWILVAMVLLVIFGRSTRNLLLLFIVLTWFQPARMVCRRIASLRRCEYVDAARVAGAGTFQVFGRHLAPNLLGVIADRAVLGIPIIIMLEGFVSFLGLGVLAPVASWGSLAGEGFTAMRAYPWLFFGPALAMTIFLVSMVLVGKGLHDSLRLHSDWGESEETSHE
jgi:ABC-type dipeptide/oligopeptide/nickel transport system permease component